MSVNRLRKPSRKTPEPPPRRQTVKGSGRLPERKPGAPPKNGHAFTAPAPRPAIAARLVPDQLEVAVQDPHWLRIGWEIGRASIDRAAAALGPEWHRAVALLRIADVTGDDRSRGIPEHVMEIELPAGASTWFVRVNEADHAYRVTLGFRTQSGKFRQVIQSRPVTPAQTLARTRPAGRVEDAVGMPLELYAGRSHPQPPRAPDAPEPVAAVLLRAAEGHEACGPYDVPKMPFQVEAELVVRGAATPHARVSLQGKPVTVSRDGRFCQRVALQAGRQVVPVVAMAGDRSQERTVVLALELSARELEPRVFEEH